MAQATDPQNSRVREAWGSQRGFLLAAIGSAIGLGNIWRFPGVAYSNGGGAFMVPYLIALLCVGIPFLLLDYAIGHRFRGTSPLAMKRIHPKAEVLGWWHVVICFVITVYYAVILAWAVSFIYYSTTLAWGDDPKKFFLKTYLQAAAPDDFSIVPVWTIFIPLLLVWVIVLVTLARGIQSGIEALTKLFIPLLLVLFVLIVIRAVTLPGATDGLTALFTPKWSALMDAKVWMQAFAQIFFSMSIGFGIMITYASYLKRNSNLTGTGLVAGFANSSFELLAGIGVFSALGFMAHSEQTTIGKLEGLTGPILSFVTFPKIISTMPLGNVFGVLFFVCLFLAGITSLLSLVQVISGAFQDKFGWSTKKASVIVCVVSMIVSLLVFSTATGLPALDTVDAFINQIGVVTAAISVAVLVTIGVPMLSRLREHLNSVSSVKIGRFWEYMIGYVIPALLTAMFIQGMLDLIVKPYGDYPQWWILIFGWGVIIVGFIVAMVITASSWKNSQNIHQQLDSAGTYPVPTQKGKQTSKRLRKQRK